MNIQLADQLGREMAWAACSSAGIVSDAMVKEAGLLEGLLLSPLTAIAAFLSAPTGSRLRSMGMGALLGAGIGVLSDKEVENRTEKGEPVKRKDMGPVMKSILTGLALGGTERVHKDVESGKPIGRVGALLTGAPMGAMLAGANPATGMIVGAISGNLLSALGAGGKLPGPLQIFSGQSPQGQEVQTQPASMVGVLPSSNPGKAAMEPSFVTTMNLADLGAVRVPTAKGSLLPQGLKIAPPEAAKKLLY